MLEDIEDTQVGKIANYHGGLYVRRTNNVCYWSIENYSGHCWQEIPSALFDELLKEKQ